MLTDLYNLWQVHLKERMHALEEKNQLSNEVQRMRKSLEDIGNQKVVIMIVMDFSNHNVIEVGQIQLLILKESQN